VLLKSDFVLVKVAVADAHPVSVVCLMASTGMFSSRLNSCSQQFRLQASIAIWN
jgi:hypothetical protein